MVAFRAASLGLVLCSLTACGRGAEVARGGGGSTGGWGDTADQSDLPPCERGLDVPFVGEPADVVAALTGTRVSSATLADGSTVPVEFTVTMNTSLSSWEWLERDGECWSTLLVEPQLVEISVGEGYIGHNETVRVVSPGEVPMLLASHSTFNHILQGDPDDAIVIEVSRTPTAERGTITDDKGIQLARW